MKKEYIVQPPDVYPAIGYSHAIKVGNTIYVSGKTGRDLQRKVVPGGFEPQCTKAFENIKLTLKAAGASLKDVVSMIMFFRNIDDVAKFQQIVPKFFEPPLPTMTAVEISRLGPDVLIEIQAVAVKDE
jgi:2-iminobutanoate/2-iminopropanoate deaminase